MNSSEISSIGVGNQYAAPMYEVKTDWLEDPQAFLLGSPGREDAISKALAWIPVTGEDPSCMEMFSSALDPRGIEGFARMVNGDISSTACHSIGDKLNKLLGVGDAQEAHHKYALHGMLRSNPGIQKVLTSFEKEPGVLHVMVTRDGDTTLAEGRTSTDTGGHSFTLVHTPGNMVRSMEGWADPEGRGAFHLHALQCMQISVSVEKGVRALKEFLSVNACMAYRDSAVKYISISPARAFNFRDVDDEKYMSVRMTFRKLDEPEAIQKKYTAMLTKGRELGIL